MHSQFAFWINTHNSVHAFFTAVDVDSRGVYGQNHARNVCSPHQEVNIYG